jgi:toxoflavin biosynthesis protein ToxD
MTASRHEAHFSERLPLSVPAIVSLDERFESLRALLATTAGRPAERIIAGSVVALFGDERVSRLPAMVRVPGGIAEIGTDPTDISAVLDRWASVGVERAWLEKEVPRHTESIGDFHLGAYPVTNYQYACFLVEAAYPRRPSTWHLGAYPWERSNHPVAGIAVEDALEYCAWIATLGECPSARLPTESEWEYAARGSQYREYPWGDEFRTDAANTREYGLHTTSPVGSFPAGRTWCGAWDMAGNVEEFTSTPFTSYQGGDAVVDDLTDLLGTYHVTRGGSFSRFGDLARCARRHGPHPGALYPIGFRLAADIDEHTDPVTPWK